MNEQVGPVREEAERLAAAVLARLGVVTGTPSGGGADAERARRLAMAAGDVAVAVSGLLRELAGGSGRAVAPGLRDGFVGLTSGLLDAAGVDPHADPPPPPRQAWRADGADPAGDAWRAATRTDWRTATRDRREEV